MESDLVKGQDSVNPAIRLGLQVLNILISLVRLFFSLLYKVALLLTILLGWLSEVFSSAEVENEEDDYAPDQIYVGATEDLSEVSLGSAERTTLIISRVIESDGTSYVTIDSPRPVDTIYAAALLNFCLSYFNEAGVGGTVGGAWMQDLSEVEPAITLTYTPIAGDDFEGYVA
jgi:hypothetical protein